MKVLERLIRTDHPESPQLVVILGAGAALILTLAGAIAACALWVMKSGDLGAGALGMFAAAVTGLTTIAVTYRDKGAHHGEEAGPQEGPRPGEATPPHEEG